MKKTLAVVGLVLWIFGSGWYYTCKIKERCYDGSPPGQTETPAQSSFPLMFEWESETPITGPEFAAWKDSLVALTKSGKKIQLSGLFNATEKNLTNESDLGMARAIRIRALFGDIPDSLISISSREDAGLKPDGQPKPAFQLGVVDVIETTQVEVPTPETIIVYFASNSAKEIKSPETEVLITNLVSFLRNSSKTIEITGFTDDVGSNEVNYTMGMLRAESIRDELINMGVPGSQIKALSKGEEQPIAPNSTGEGRAKNRRSEIIVK